VSTSDAAKIRNYDLRAASLGLLRLLSVDGARKWR
jgi:hypothetical protein